MLDPLALVASNVGGVVCVYMQNDDRVTGTLASVDDHGNLLLRDWRCDVGASAAAEVVAAAHDTHKRVAVEAAGARRVAVSATQTGVAASGALRLVRGSQVKTIALSVVLQ